LVRKFNALYQRPGRVTHAIQPELCGIELHMEIIDGEGRTQNETFLSDLQMSFHSFCCVRALFSRVVPFLHEVKNNANCQQDRDLFPVLPFGLGDEP